MISRAVHVVVHVSRMQDGRRRVTGISEVAGQQGTAILLHPVFQFERTGITSDGTIIGNHTQKANTILVERFRAAGLYNGGTSGEINR
jgi:pilus assembly protein CpaF